MSPDSAWNLLQRKGTFTAYRLPVEEDSKAGFRTRRRRPRAPDADPDPTAAPRAVFYTGTPLVVALADGNTKGVKFKIPRLHPYFGEPEDRREYVCGLCRYALPRVSSGKSHFECHDAFPHSFSCFYCSEMQHSMETLFEHTQLHFDEEKQVYLCLLCGKSFTRQSNLRSHMKSAHPLHMPTKRTYTTAKDPTLVVPLAAERRPVALGRGDHSEMLLRDDDCITLDSEGFGLERSNDGVLLLRLPKSSKRRSFLCEVCRYGFTKSSALKRHLDTRHKNNSILECYYCAHPVESLAELQEHLIGHRPRVMCPVCKVEVNPDEHARSHPDCPMDRSKALVAKSPQSPFKCRVCSQGFQSASGLSAHSTACPKERRSSDIPEKALMRMAMRIEQTGLTEIPPGMELDGYGRIALKLPLVSSRRRHLCTFCRYSFMKAKDLSKHLESRHLDRQDFECFYCWSTFSTLPELGQHLVTHAAESQPFTCLQCSMRFKSSSHLHSHHHLRHPRRPS